ncbi:phospholipid scramblase 3-like [Pseudophryne corroboree]|uniref:phospholipid scramblase 3-like n=1 Tax=Pseudophryne corroboree TaxID=495146 RepID=UPI003081733C
MERLPITPPGLEYLVQVSQFHVNQTQTSLWESHCIYDVISPDGLLVYGGIQHREFCGPTMDVRIHNTQGHNVLNLLLPSDFCSWDTTLQISDSSGNLLGYIEKNLASFTTSFNILNPFHQICLKVKGPGWGEDFMSDANYQVVSADKSVSVGLITRVWRGFSKEVFNPTDNYVVQFPHDLDVTMKAMLLACTMFIDLLLHEERRKRRNN